MQGVKTSAHYIYPRILHYQRRTSPAHAGPRHKHRGPQREPRSAHAAGGGGGGRRARQRTRSPRRWRSPAAAARVRQSRILDSQLSKSGSWFLASMSLILGRILGSCSRCGSQSQVLSASFWQDRHFFALVAADSRFSQLGCLHGAHSALSFDFFQEFDFMASKTPNLRSATGHFGLDLAPSSLILGRILVLDQLSQAGVKYWKDSALP